MARSDPAADLTGAWIREVGEWKREGAGSPGLSAVRNRHSLNRRIYSGIVFLFRRALTAKCVRSPSMAPTSMAAAPSRWRAGRARVILPDGMGPAGRRWEPD